MNAPHSPVKSAAESAARLRSGLDGCVGVLARLAMRLLAVLNPEASGVTGEDGFTSSAHRDVEGRRRRGALLRDRRRQGIHQDGHRIGELGRGSGMGEVALLQGGPRTASVVATTSLTAFSLDRESFLATVTGHVPTQRDVSNILQQFETATVNGDRTRGGLRTKSIPPADL